MAKKISGLYAFWRYDRYPYVLGGEVDKMDDDGNVYVLSYARWFAPIKLIPVESGRPLKAELDQLAAGYELEKKQVTIRWDAALAKLMPEAIPEYRKKKS